MSRMKQYIASSKPSGSCPDGRPNSDILVVSDHGFAPFHTAVNMTAFCLSRLRPTKVRAVTSGPAVNVYINLQGTRARRYGVQQRIPFVAGTAGRGDAGVERQESELLRPWPWRGKGLRPGPPLAPAPNEYGSGFRIGDQPFVGQDSGDVYATSESRVQLRWHAGSGRAAHGGRSLRRFPP